MYNDETREPQAVVTHRCVGLCRDEARPDYWSEKPCPAFRRSDGSLERTCGEPCSFVMGKGGSAEPDWGETIDGYRVTPAAPDGDVEAPFRHLVRK